MRNHEGYKDPTAGQAINNIKADDHKADLVIKIIKLVCKQAGYQAVCTQRSLRIIELVIRR